MNMIKYKEVVPILYSFRRCPYAIRARYALNFNSKRVCLREVLLKDKPEELFNFTEKGTVPVLVLHNHSSIISESLEIMSWSFSGKNDWTTLVTEESKKLIVENDQYFKYWLDRYKYFDRYPECSKEYYRKKCETFLESIEIILKNSVFLAGNSISFIDIAIFPFIRQFALFDMNWFVTSPYKNTQNWLNTFLCQTEFNDIVMKKFNTWKEFNSEYLYP